MMRKTCVLCVVLLGLLALACNKPYKEFQPIDSSQLPRPELGLRLKVVRVEDILRMYKDFTSEDEKVLLVSKVKEGMPAEKAGVQVGDLMLRIDAIKVTGMREAIAVMQRKQPGEPFTLDLFRRGSHITLVGTLNK